MRIYWMLLLLPSICRGLCPVGCYCDDDQTLSVTCGSRSDLTVIPITLNPDIIQLNITGTLLDHLDAAFQFYGKLTTLDLSHNRIRTLEKRCFENQDRLQRLDLSYNQIRSLESRTLHGLSRLKYLSLRGNELFKIHPEALTGLTKLKELILRENRLHMLLESSFKGLSGLFHLDLAFNRLFQTSNLALEPLIGLENLNLAGNQLKIFTFSHLPTTIRSLNLTGVGITNPDIISEILIFLTRLHTLDLSSNPVSRLPILKSESLITLNLEYNSFTSFDFDECKFESLKTLSLSHQGSLKEIRGSIPKTVIDLHITDNPGLSRIPSGLIPRDHSLTSVNLSGNRLQTLNQDFNSEERLDFFLDLSRNPLICDCKLEWLMEQNPHSNSTSFQCVEGTSFDNLPLSCGIMIWILLCLSLLFTLASMILIWICIRHRQHQNSSAKIKDLDGRTAWRSENPFSYNDRRYWFRPEQEFWAEDEIFYLAMNESSFARRDTQ